MAASAEARGGVTMGWLGFGVTRGMWKRSSMPTPLHGKMIRTASLPHALLHHSGSENSVN
jgi:hypothetical protein